MIKSYFLGPRGPLRTPLVPVVPSPATKSPDSNLILFPIQTLSSRNLSHSIQYTTQLYRTLDMVDTGQCPVDMDIVVDNVAPDQGSGSRIRIKPRNLSRSFFFSSIFVYPLPSHATSPTHGSNDNVSLPCLPLSTRGPF